MLKSLELFKEKGQFEFTPIDNLSDCCNAPRHSSGIYLIYAEEFKTSKLIYIGISGRESPVGEIIHRKDGLGGRIVNGKQFGLNRRRSWPMKMNEDGIKKIIVKWYVTYGELNKDFPRNIENTLLSKILQNNGSLPLWNKKV
ncbi:hypothetical protein [Aurantibacter sp.]|uniref:hypothetical protein n=1 Tax=Aurantibacter sp. TaxID=2807103 RepID=UPI003264E3DB